MTPPFAVIAPVNADAPICDHVDLFSSALFVLLFVIPPF
jgi:hypothetical protein